jgi:hypothetical protein
MKNMGAYTPGEVRVFVQSYTNLVYNHLGIFLSLAANVAINPVTKEEGFTDADIIIGRFEEALSNYELNSSPNLRAEFPDLSVSDLRQRLERTKKALLEITVAQGVEGDCRDTCVEKLTGVGGESCVGCDGKKNS